MELPVDLFKQIVGEMVPYHKYLGLVLEAISKERALVKIPWKEAFVGDPRHIRWHGGLIATGMDAVGSAIAMTTLTGYEDSLSTIDMRIDFLKGAEKGDLYFEGQIVRSGNRMVVTRMHAYQEDPKHPLAAATAVFNVKRKGLQLNEG